MENTLLSIVNVSEIRHIFICLSYKKIHIRHELEIYFIWIWTQACGILDKKFKNDENETHNELTMFCAKKERIDRWPT